MKYRAYFGIKYHEDNRNRDEIESLSAALINNGIETICIVRDIEKWGDVQLSSKELMKTTFDGIDNSDFVILEMTEKGVGLGIEAGYAIAKGKPVIVLTKEIQNLSSTMQGIANVVIQYSQPEEIDIFAHNNSLQGIVASLRSGAQSR